MTARINLGEFSADVMFKNIKNVHLSVYPPIGRVLIAAPERMNLETIRVFAISKLAWIKRQRQKLCDQPRETPREHLERESHFLWGKRYLLTVIEGDHTPSIETAHSGLVLRVRSGASEEKTEPRRRMVSRAAESNASGFDCDMGTGDRRRCWKILCATNENQVGSCNHLARSIRLNTELAKKPKECLEYIVLHEMIHLLEPTHNARFIAMMDRFMPSWRLRRDQLNQLPVRHEEWRY